MNILDENIVESQRLLLRNWRLHFRQIGHEVGTGGMADDRIPALLLRLGHPTFFTRDLGFYDPSLCHAAYCIVCLDVAPSEAASFIRRLLRHPAFDARAKRMGMVLRVGHSGVHAIGAHQKKEQVFRWSKA